MRYLENQVNGEHLYIEYDGLIIKMVSHADHSDKDGHALRRIEVAFEDRDILKRLAAFPAWSKRNITAIGSVVYRELITQTGSAWDAEESVVGIDRNWTVLGLISVNIYIDRECRLTGFSFNEGKPFTTPYRNPDWRDLDDISYKKPSELNVTYLYDPWGNMIYNPGDVSINNRTHIAHIIASSSPEPLYFTPEKDVPGYLYRCGGSGGNCSSEGWVSSEMTMADYERGHKDGLKCPVCFPK